MHARAYKYNLHTAVTPVIVTSSNWPSLSSLQRFEPFRKRCKLVFWFFRRRRQRRRAGGALIRVVGGRKLGKCRYISGSGLDVSK